MSSSAFLKSKMQERAGLADLMTNTLDKCAAEAKEPTPEQRQQLDGWGTQVKALDNEILQLRTALEANDRFTDVIDAAARHDETAERRASSRRDEKTPERTTRKGVGTQFVESEAFLNYRGRGTSEPVEFDNFLQVRAALETGDLPIQPYIWDGPRGYVTTTPLLDVIGREVVTSGSVEYITWGTADPLAAVVPEGELKPEAAITPTTTPLSLDTYAHWKAVTRQALEDYPRISSIVEGKLRGGLASALEKAAADVIAAAAWGTVTGTDLSASIRLGMADIQEAGYAANAVLLNPTDFANLDIAASGAANNGPTAFPTFWGVRPIAVGAIPAGTAYVGNFTEAVTWFDRATAAVYMTDSHADYFVRNLLVILAEQRSAFAATELTAAVKITITPAAPEAAAAKASK